MSRTVVIKLHSQYALVTVVRDAPGPLAASGAQRVELPGGERVEESGKRLAAAVQALDAGRAPTVVVLPRAELYWQSIDLPPAPASDLPALVHLQAQRDMPLADDGTGFDYIPLEGDDAHPHRVLGFGLTSAQLERVRSLCSAAGVRLDRLTAEPLGWVELGRRADDDLPSGSTVVFAAAVERQATVWAACDEQLRLLRTIWLPAEGDPADDAAALAGELRRTLLALHQRPHADQGSAADGANGPACLFLGEDAEAMAKRLTEGLGRDVRAVELATLVDASPKTVRGELAELAPLVGLGAAVAQRRPLLADLVHPRRPPAPPSQRRTYSLAAAAALALVLAGGWRAYRALEAPLEAAAAADAERNALAPLLEKLAADEARVAAIESWKNQSLDVLAELQAVATTLRPAPLDSPEFKADEDVVVTKFSVTNRQMTIDAAARSSQALQPAENRLRAADYRVDRGAVDADAKDVPGYSVRVTALVEPAAETPPAEAAP